MAAKTRVEFRLQFVESAGDYLKGEFLDRVYNSHHACLVAQKLFNSEYRPPVRAVAATVAVEEILREPTN